MNEEIQIQDAKNRSLNQGDLVMLVDINGDFEATIDWLRKQGYCLDNEDLAYNSGDILQFIGGMEYNIGCFIHCKTRKRTDFFADRTLKINQTTKK